MARPSLQIEMKFDNLHCHDEGDGWGDSEAYLWTVYFKIDGDTVILADNFFLQGTCSIFPTPGSHGNLGDSDIGEGDDVPVPAAIGEFQTTLRPIPVTPFVAETLNIEDVGGVVGVALVLMEENQVSDSGAEAGHAALNNFVEQAINSIIPTLGVSNPDVTEDEINALAAQASGAISDAVSDAQGVWDNILSWLDGDDLIGTRVFTFSHDTLMADAFHDMNHRFERFVPVLAGNPPHQVLVKVQDFEIFGRMQGIQPCPAAAAASQLRANGFVNDQEARAFLEAANQFRRRHFIGDRGLGAWWGLAQRNTASIAGVIHAHPEAVRKAAPTALAELASAAAGDGKITESFVTHATDLLTLLATHGNRRLRLDAKMALIVLPSLVGKPFREAADILRKARPTRLPHAGAPHYRAPK